MENPLFTVKVNQIYQCIFINVFILSRTSIEAYSSLEIVQRTKYTEYWMSPTLPFNEKGRQTPNKINK
jgi:hypothetical protein